jgi:hypothetical protein
MHERRRVHDKETRGLLRQETPNGAAHRGKMLVVCYSRNIQKQREFVDAKLISLVEGKQGLGGSQI